MRSGYRHARASTGGIIAAILVKDATLNRGRALSLLDATRGLVIVRFVPKVLARLKRCSAKGGEVESRHLGLIPGVVCLESGGPRLPWTCPERTSCDGGVVGSMKECRDENQASYGTSIGSDYKSCLGSNSFPQ
jgi:hypothetical protein